MHAFTVEMATELVHVFNCAGINLIREGNVFGLYESKTSSVADMQNNKNIPEVSDTGDTVNLSIYDCKNRYSLPPMVSVGIGDTMLAAMDIRLASEKAKIGFVFGKIGITTEACSR
jgi:hypothetical protein